MASKQENAPPVCVVKLDRRRLLGFRTLPSSSADIAAADAEEALRLLHNKIGFGELPPPPVAEPREEGASDPLAS